MKSILIGGLIMLVAVAGSAALAIWQFDLLGSSSIDELAATAASAPAGLVEPGGSVTPGQSGQPKVVVDVTEYDFGSAKNNAKGMSHSFVLRNEGDAPLQIMAATASCNECTFFEFSEQPIPPGGSGEVLVKWDVKSTNDVFRQSVSVYTNDRQTPKVELFITGKVLQTLKAVPPELVLSKVPAGAAFEAKVRVQAYFAGDLEISELELVGRQPTEYFEIKQVPVPAGELVEGAKSGVDLVFTIKPGLPLGAIDQKIHFRTNLMDVPELAIPVQGMVVSDVDVIDTGWVPERGTLVLGPVNRQEGLNRTIHLLVRGEHQEGLVLESAEVEPESLKVTIGETSKSGSVTRVPVLLRIAPGSPPVDRMGANGGQIGEIIIPTNKPELGKIRLRVQFAIEG